MASTNRSQAGLLPRERHLQILSELEEHGAVRVTELAKQFSVAEETIRRDLDKLGSKGRLTRTHGGALSIRSDRHDLPISVRKSEHAEFKQAIARHALHHIEEHDVVALDASSTAMELACLLPNMPLTVVTYSLDVARLLVDRPSITVISPGGELDPNAVCFVGPVTEANLRRFAFGKAFLSCKAIDLERGYSEATTVQASIKALIMELADQSYLLADHSKFGVRSLAYIDDLDAPDVLITDNKTDPVFLEPIEAAGVVTEVAEVS